MTASIDARGPLGAPWSTAAPLSVPTLGANAAPDAALAPAPATAKAAKPKADHDSNPILGAARWTVDHMGQIGTVLGVASLIAAVPLARGGAADAAIGTAARATLGRRLATRFASTSLGSSAVAAARRGASVVRAGIDATPGARAAVDSARRGWSTLRAGREAIGDTVVGRALIKTQTPLYVAGAALGTLGLAQDVQDWRDGKGSIKNTAFHLLSVAPLVGDVTKRVARAKAAATEATAAAHAADALDAAKQGTASARAVADDVAAPVAVRSVLDDAASQLGTVKNAATRKAAVVAEEARVVGTGSAAALPAGRTFAVGSLKREVADAEAAAARALDVTADAAAPTAAIESRLEIALGQTRDARRVLEGAEQHAARLTTAAKGAESLQGMANTTGVAAGVANNTMLVSRADTNATQVHRSTTGLVIAALGSLLSRNASAAPVEARTVAAPVAAPPAPPSGR